MDNITTPESCHVTRADPITRCIVASITQLATRTTPDLNLGTKWPVADLGLRVWFLAPADWRMHMLVLLLGYYFGVVHKCLSISR